MKEGAPEGGLRLTKLNRAAKQPLVSIVTVTFNAEALLEKTILSVINQTFVDKEYIIIDGGSNDGTVSLIRRYETAIDYWRSEPDEGVYDGMNKAIRLCRGEWINFMNAGDSFNTTAVLADIFGHSYSDDISVIYGHTMNQYGEGFEAIEKCRPLEAFYREKPFCHQSVFVRTAHMREFGFDTRFKIAADYDFFYRLYAEGKKFVLSNRVIANYDMNGISSNYVDSFLESRAVTARYAPEHIGFYNRWRLLMILFKKNLKKILPNKFIYWLRIKRLTDQSG